MRRAVPVVVLAVTVALGITTDARQTPARAPSAPPLAASHQAAEPRTSNLEPRTQNLEPRTQNLEPRTPLSVAAQNELVGKYCSTCHSARAKAGGLVLAGFDATKAIENGELTEKMIRKLRARMMPPAGAARPDDATVMAMVGTLEGVMDKHAAANPRPGWRPFQRLNRAEYAAAVNDLIGIDVDVNAWLPPDTISDGYDNVADVQTFSSQLMQGYLRAASQISRLAIGDKNASATSVTFKVEHSRSQMVRAAGAPIGTRGGISLVHVFPSDGEYVIKASMIYAALGGLFGRTPLLAMGFVEQLDVSINGERVALLDILPTMTETDFGQNKGQNGMEVRTPPIHIKAGPQRISAAFIQRLEGPADDLLAPVENTAEGGDGYGTITLPHMRDMTIVGPSKVTGVSETVSRKKIFSCRPTSAAEEEACAAKILRDLTTRAYRGKGGATGLQDAMKFYEMGRQGLAAPELGAAGGPAALKLDSGQRAEAGDFESGIRLALQSILVSPRFVFRMEGGPATEAATGTYRLADLDLASRLSFFIWGTGPDAELIKAAELGQLTTRAGIEKQARRLLADKRSEALSTRFASQWLRLQDLEKLHPEFTEYPLFDETLRDAMRRETELFFDSLVREDRNALDLLNADYSFVNERLARHYGISRRQRRSRSSA